jgi:integrase
VLIDAAVAEILWAWRLRCCYNQPNDWVFASPARKGKQPYWPNSICRVYLKPILQDDLKIKEPVGWHTLRHSLGTLMKANGENVKTIQETLRHANFKVTMDVYAQGTEEIRRTAHTRAVRQIMGTEGGESDEEYFGYPDAEILIGTFSKPRFSVQSLQVLFFVGVPDGI